MTDSCYEKAKELNEPTFTLRASDISAAGLIQMWISLNPQISREKYEDAQAKMQEFRSWPKKKKAD